MSRGSSRRLIEEPNSVGMSISSDVGAGGRARRMGTQRGGRRLDGRDDVLVAGAAAVVALDRVADLRFRRIGVRGEEVHRRQDHSRRAKAALQSMLLPERLLQRVQGVTRGQPFDGRDRLSLRLYGKDSAALDRLAV